MSLKQLAALTVSVLLAGATLARADDVKGTIGAVLDAKTIVIMNNLSSAPWQFRDAAGNPAGFSIDLDRMIAAHLDVDLKLIDTEWAGLIPSLLAHKSDILATSMSTTFKRAAQVLFTTETWYRAGVVAMVKPDSPVKDWTELNVAGKKIAVVSGTVSADVAKAFFAKAEVSSYPLDVDTYQALKTGRVDAALNDSAVMKQVSADYGYGTLKQPRELIQTDTWAFAVRPGDDYAWQYLNFFLAKIKDNGDLDLLTKYWAEGETWKKDFLEKNSGLSEQRQDLVKMIGISDYVPEAGAKNRTRLQ